MITRRTLACMFLLAACETSREAPLEPRDDASTRSPEPSSDAGPSARDAQAGPDAETDVVSEQLPADAAAEDATASPEDAGVAGDASRPEDCASCDAGPAPMPPEPAARCIPFNVVTDPDFEQGPAILAPPWKSEGNVVLSSQGATSYRGRRHARVEGADDWNAVTQRVAVKPNADYTLSVAIQTSSADFGTGYLGLRTSSGDILKELSFPAQAAYRELSLQVNVGRNALVDVFVGTWAPARGTWMRIDSVSLAPLGQCDAPPVCVSATSCTMK